MTTPYFDRLEACRRERGSALCVGIDPRIDRIPASLRGPDVRTTLERFGTAVHERTRPHAACWKPQIAFFEAHGLPGLTAFVHIVQTIRSSGGFTGRRYCFRSLSLQRLHRSLGAVPYGYIRSIF